MTYIIFDKYNFSSNLVFTDYSQKKKKICKLLKITKILVTLLQIGNQI